MGLSFRKKVGPVVISKRAGKKTTVKVKVGPFTFTPTKKKS